MTAPRLSALVLLLLPACLAAAAPSPDAPRGRDFTLLALDDKLRAPVSIGAGDLEVTLGGEPRPVIATESITDRPWTIVLFVDAPLSTEEGVERAAAALAEQAPALTELGRVEVVLADPQPEVLLPPSRDPGRLRAALGLLPAETLETDELGVVRETASTLDAASAARADAIEEELDLLTASRDGLLEHLAANLSDPAPRLLLLVQDGFELDPGPFYGDLATAASAVSAFRELSRTVAADGWTVLALALGGRGEPFSDPLEPLRLLTEESGGELLTRASDLQASLARLGRRALVRWAATGPDATLRPLAVRPLRAGLSLVAPRWAAAATPTALAEARARRALAEAESLGEVGVQAALRPGRSGGDRLTLEALVDLADLPPTPESVLRVTLLVEQLDQEPIVIHEARAAAELPATGGWLFRQTLEPTDEIQGAAVVIEELRSGRWGAVAAELTDLPLDPLPGKIVAADAGGGAPDTPAASARQSPVIRVLPPSRRPATGRVRLRTLVSSAAVSRVGFFVDGELVAEDDSPPFETTTDLGEEARPHAIRVVAYSASGRLLGEHALDLNRAAAAAAVKLILHGDGGDGTVEAELEVSGIPPQQLDRVELYWNERLAATLRAAPFRARIPAPTAGPEDYIRGVAYLTDGSSLEDVRLIAARGPVEEVAVNLVQLYAVVTDRDGAPVETLAREDFTILQSGKERAIERFAHADDVALTLGLVIDTSQSMWVLMPDTKQAASRFLVTTLGEQDRAFLVDFDTRPRLAHETTGDLPRLLRRFAELRADGFTALFDAVVFSMLEFDEGAGRKALVVLTDGDDYRSRFGPRRCVEYGRRLGVPVYIISLAGLDDARRGARKLDLEGVSEATGGRVYYIDDPTQLGQAYDQINRELRSQYLLAYATDRQLNLEELDRIEVKVRGRELRVRAVVGGQERR